MCMTIVLGSPAEYRPLFQNLISALERSDGRQIELNLGLLLSNLSRLARIAASPNGDSGPAVSIAAMAGLRRHEVLTVLGQVQECEAHLARNDLGGALASAHLAAAAWERQFVSPQQGHAQ